MTNIGKNIKKYRLKQGYSQYGLARILGVNRTSIALYEQGRSTPTFAMLLKIKELIDCSYDTLIEGELK
jgi:transcriptional regulator with XRE-family HTH domain